MIISLSTGKGHVEAAKAIEEKIKLNYKDLESLHIDGADYVSDFLKITTIDSYNFLVNYYPKTWGKIFYYFNNKKIISAFKKTTLFLRKLNSGNFLKKIKEYNPDYIITTHFIFTDLLLSFDYIKENKIPVSVIITDYFLHNIWIDKKVTKYFVATEKMKRQFLKENIFDEKNIIVSGIPVKNAFYTKTTGNFHFKLNNDPYIMIMAGSCGQDYVLNTLNFLSLNYKNNINIITVCNNKKKLYKKISNLKLKNNINLINILFSDKIAELMQLSKLVISKAGGLTASECITTNTPILISKSIPGQEEANSKYISENNFGKIIKNQNDLLKYIDFYTKQKKQDLKHLVATEIIIDNIKK